MNIYSVCSLYEFLYGYSLPSLLYIFVGHGWQATKELGAIFYAHGPSFKRGYKTKQPLQAIDVYPLMCHLLDIKPLTHNGSLANMKEVLATGSPSSGVVIMAATLLKVLYLASFCLWVFQL